MKEDQEVSQFSLKYRPIYFKDVYGQDSTVKALRDRISNDDYPQAICLKGPYGCGKSSLAYITAAAMMSHDIDGEPNWDSPDCKSILNQSFDRDVMLLDASRWSGKDAMLEFTQCLETRPLYSKSGIRVCIIEEADQASNAAMLSLLKILESTKPWNKFILCSMEEKGVPKSILSRCQVYNIKLLATKDIMYGLKHIMELEGLWKDDSIPLNFRTEGLKVIADCSEGSMRNAVQYLEKCITSKVYDPNEISSLLGIMDEMATWKILDLLLDKSKDEDMWRKFIWMKSGDETMHFYNYAVMLLSEGLLYKETGVTAEKGNDWRMKKMAESPNLESLYYCLSLHPQMAKPYLRQSDLLGVLVAYYQGVNFKPNSVPFGTFGSTPITGNGTVSVPNQNTPDYQKSENGTEIKTNIPARKSASGISVPNQNTPDDQRTSTRTASVPKRPTPVDQSITNGTQENLKVTRYDLDGTEGTIDHTIGPRKGQPIKVATEPEVEIDPEHIVIGSTKNPVLETKNGIQRRTPKVDLANFDLAF